MTREEENEKLAKELKELLIKHSMYIDVRIYFNNRAFDSEEGLIENIKAEDYFEYVEEDSVSMSFEGELYEEMASGGDIHEKIEEIGEKYGRYFEFGNMWNISFYI